MPKRHCTDSPIMQKAPRKNPKRGPKATKIDSKSTAVRLDPFEHLNYDILHNIASHLSIAEVVRSERVSQRWKIFLKDWVTRYAVPLVLRPIFNPQNRGLSLQSIGYANIEKFGKMESMGVSLLRNMLTREAQQLYCAQTGRLSSAVFTKRYESSDVYAGGKYKVWVGVIPRLGICISWKRSVVRRASNNGDMGQVPVWRLWRPGGSGARIEEIIGNDDGVLLIRFLLCESHGIFRRDVIYSLADEKVLWKRDMSRSSSSHDLRWPRPLYNGDIVPFVLGKSRVYAAHMDQQTNRRLLVAYDIRSGDRLYESNVLSETWDVDKDSIQSRDSCLQFAQIWKAPDGEELILQISNIEPSYSGIYEDVIARGIDVIRGENGQLIQSIESLGTELGTIIRYTPSEQLTIVNDFRESEDNIIRGSHIPRSRHVVIKRRYSYLPEGGFNLQCTDAVLGTFEQDLERSFCRPHIAVNPFLMAAIVAQQEKEQYLGDGEGSTLTWDLKSHPLVATGDEKVASAVQTILRKCLGRAADDMVIRELYVLGEGRSLTLPPSNKARSSRKLLEVPSRYSYGRLEFGVDGNARFYSCNGSYRLKFD